MEVGKAEKFQHGVSQRRQLATRKIFAWRISNTLKAEFCTEALNEAACRFGPPQIMNTDQGSQFTSFAWTETLKRAGIRISQDGKGRCMDCSPSAPMAQVWGCDLRRIWFSS